MGASWRRLSLGSVGFVCLTILGCMQFPYYLPELNYVPSIDAKCASKEVVAFRVDVTQKTELKEKVTATVVEGEEKIELTRIAASAHGATSQQVGVSYNHGWRYVGFWNHTTENTSHSLALRFYRPGYETIELHAGQNTRELDWKQAADLEAQEKALDDLFGSNTPETGKKANLSLQRSLEPGSKSPAHREALRFGAREYERLANIATASPDEQAQNARLIEKAQRLRSLAEKQK